MKSIGFSNFKRFKECPDLELTGVNYLVGKNNAGKTTFSHAARLAANFINQIETGGSFEAVFNFEIGEETISRYCGYNTMLHAGSNDGVIEFRIDYGDFEVHFGIWKKHNYFGFIKEQITDWVYDSFYSQYPDSEKGPEIDPEWLQSEINKRMRELQEKNPAKYQDLLQKDRMGKGEVSYIRYYDKKNRIAGIVDLQHSGTKIVFYDFPVQEQKELSRLQAIISSLPEEDKPTVVDRIDELISSKKSSEYEIVLSGLHFKGLGRTKQKGLPVFWSIQRLVENCLEGKNTDSWNDSVDYARVKEELEKNDRRFRLKDFCDSFSERLFQQIPSTSRHIGHFTDDSGVNSALFEKYYDLKIGDDLNLSSTLCQWMSELEIGDGIVVEHVDDVLACFVKLHTRLNGRRHNYQVPFESLGVGSRQLIILLVNIAIVITESRNNNYPTLVTIEEPEQNLHPAIQSRLADMFLDFYLKYGCQSIIETHSEYMIRRTQLLVANGIKEGHFSLESNPLKVYYFPDKDGLPYDMLFNERGRFEHDFGPGFLDVSGKINLELLDLSSVLTK